MWVCLWNPAPESIPRPVSVQAVYAKEDDALVWVQSGPSVSANSGFRTIEKHEVVQ